MLSVGGWTTYSMQHCDRWVHGVVFLARRRCVREWHDVIHDSKFNVRRGFLAVCCQAQAGQHEGVDRKTRSLMSCVRKGTYFLYLLCVYLYFEVCNDPRGSWRRYGPIPVRCLPTFVCRVTAVVCSLCFRKDTAVVLGRREKFTATLHPFRRINRKPDTEQNIAQQDSW